ncbi:MAG: anti-sigma factor antagonist [Collinsella sp.]|nr:anti-sigma factor antagonist [Collinsella sp.]
MKEWSDIAVIAPARDIDISTVPLLRERVEGLIDGGMRRILINCKNVGFIDSTGLAFLLSSARRLGRLEGMLSIVDASPNIVRFIQIARLIDVLHVTASDKPPIPLLSPNTPPLWSRSLPIREGMENLGYYRHKVVDMLSTTALSPDECFDTALAVGEALSNAYDHACVKGSTMTVIAFSDRVVIEVSDRGCGFELAPDEEVEASMERGRGIKLMRMLVDSVEVARRVNGPGTVVRLVKLTSDHGGVA